MLDSIDQAEGVDDATRRRVKFFAKQFTDAMSPTNVPWFNPDVLEETMRTGGANFRRGWTTCSKTRATTRDVRRWSTSRRSRSARTSATTPGKVVYRNALIELIQYAPTQPRIYARPLVIVPPWINKFYILDLQPSNSFVKYATDAGRNTFVVSWRNPDASLAEMTWADYLQLGPIAAATVAAEIAGSTDVDAIGYCIGGTLLATALAYLARTGSTAGEQRDVLRRAGRLQRSRRGMAFLTDEALEYDRAADERSGRARRPRDGRHVQHAARQRPDLGRRGQPLPARQGRARLRPAVLEQRRHAHPARDALYYLRQMYVANNLVKPDALEVDGVPIDLAASSSTPTACDPGRPHRAVALGLRDDPPARRRDDVPARCVGTHRRHHQPARQEEGGLVGRSRPARPTRPIPTSGWRPRRSTRARGGRTGSPGSRSAHPSRVEAPAATGSERYAPLADAPGTYVLER